MTKTTHQKLAERERSDERTVYDSQAESFLEIEDWLEGENDKESDAQSSSPRWRNRGIGVIEDVKRIPVTSLSALVRSRLPKRVKRQPKHGDPLEVLQLTVSHEGTTPDSHAFVFPEKTDLTAKHNLPTVEGIYEVLEEDVGSFSELNRQEVLLKPFDMRRSWVYTKENREYTATVPFSVERQMVENDRYTVDNGEFQLSNGLRGRVNDWCVYTDATASIFGLVSGASLLALTDVNGILSQHPIIFILVAVGFGLVVFALLRGLGYNRIQSMIDSTDTHYTP